VYICVCECMDVEISPNSQPSSFQSKILCFSCL